MALRRFTGWYADLRAPERAAIVALLGPSYRKLTFPTPAAIAEAFGVAPGTPAFAAQEAELARRFAAALAPSFADRDAVAALLVPTDGGVAAVATMQTVRGARSTPLADSIGDAASSLPTHRLLRGFRYPPEAGLDPRATPESALAEFGRLAVADPAQLHPLVRAGALTPREAAYVVRHALGELVARSVARGWALPAPPRGYLFNTQPRLARVLRRKGLGLRPLFLDGAEPTPAARSLPGPGAASFRRWPAELAGLVPEEVLREGIAAAIAHLAARGFTRWHRLALSLPYLLPDDLALARAVARLALGCVGPAGDAREAQVAA